MAPANTSMTSSLRRDVPYLFENSSVTTSTTDAHRVIFVPGCDATKATFPHCLCAFLQRG